MMGTSNTAQIQFVTPVQLSLLRAGLLDAPMAAQALKDWFALRQEESACGLEGLDPGSRRLLPLVYLNLKASVPVGLRNEMRLIHHEYWAENQRHLYYLENLLGWFEKNNIPTLVLKGMALSLLHYRDMAARPMSDVDVLVPENRAQEAIARLQENGWAPFLYDPNATKKSYFYRHTHAIPFKRSDHSTLDLHWHVLSESTFRGADEPFWSGSVPLVVRSIHTLTLNPTDQLIHACVHGFRFNEIPSIRWVADAVAILRTAAIDWTRLVDLAKHLQVTLPLAASLSFLRTTFPTPIPERVIDEMNAIRVDHAERRYFEALVHHNADWREVWAYNLERHRRANRGRHPVFGAVTLPRQFQLHYNLPELKSLGSFAFSRFTKRLRKKVGLS